MPKATTPTAQRPVRRHNPLQDDILATGPLKAKSSKQKAKDEREDGEGFVSANQSRNILRLGRELAEEDEASKGTSQPKVDLFGIESRFGAELDADERPFGDLDDEDGAWGDEDEIVEEIEIDPEDLETYRKFLPEDEPADMLNQHGWGTSGADEEEQEGVNLADLILEKIAAHENGQASREKEPMADGDFELHPKVVEVYTKIGQILSRYKSGPLPKPFRILPTLPHWEDIIDITEPERWTPNATYQATRIFSACKPAICQRFNELVLLNKVREDIYDNKKLNVHLFNSLKKSLYKPQAFFKGILFPLLSSHCTVREAVIVSAVLARVSVPVLHSAAAIKGLCEIAAIEASQGTEGGGAANILIKTLLEKKYALPYQVIDTLVFHFLRFRSVDPASIKQEDAMKGVTGGVAKSLPVIFHQCLLAFAQRYRTDLSEDQREALLDLLLTHGHHAIGPEIRRELLAGRGQGVVAEQQEPVFDGDDTMLVDS